MRRAILTIFAAFVCSLLGYFNYQVNASPVTQPTPEDPQPDLKAHTSKTNKKGENKFEQAKEEVKSTE